MSRALRHVQKCLEKQVQYSELNAFVTCARATQLQDAASVIADSESDGMNSCASFSRKNTNKHRLSSGGKDNRHQGQHRYERLPDHSIFKDPRRLQLTIQCDCRRQTCRSRCPDMWKDKSR